MAIRVVTIANPAVGTDWSFTVPGQWSARLVGVSAVLNTGGSLTTLPDETATANDLHVIAANAHYTQGAAGPFAGGAQNFAIACDGAPVGNSTYAQGSSLLAYSAATISFDWWHKVVTSIGGTIGALFDFNRSAVSSLAELCIVGLGTTQYSVVPVVANSIQTTADPNTPNGGWHHRAIVWDGVNVISYLDGVQTATHNNASPGAGFTSRPGMPGGRSGAPIVYSLAAVAAYAFALSGAQVAAHAAAGSTAAGYKAAVLADAPAGLWMLSGVRVGLSRTVDLQITDGTRLVAEYPSTFAATVAPSFTYSWQTLGSGALASTDGSTNTIPIPAMTLPAGYVIRSRTLDLAGTDQWSQVTFWFDDGTGPGGGPNPGDPLAFRSVLLLG